MWRWRRRSSNGAGLLTWFFEWAFPTVGYVRAVENVRIARFGSSIDSGTCVYVSGGMMKTSCLPTKRKARNATIAAASKFNPILSMSGCRCGSVVHDKPK